MGLENLELRIPLSFVRQIPCVCGSDELPLLYHMLARIVSGLLIREERIFYKHNSRTVSIENRMSWVARDARCVSGSFIPTNKQSESSKKHFICATSIGDAGKTFIIFDSSTPLPRQRQKRSIRYASYTSSIDVNINLEHD